MILEHYLMPDRLFGHFYEVTPEMLAELGIRHIFSDIDNTLVTYDDAVPTEEVVAWCRRMEQAGIAVAFVSNNDEDRVARFSQPLGIPFRAKAGKPLTKKLRQIMAECGASGADSLFLGDQLLTDCMAGKLAGMRVFIVPPIKDRTGWFFRFKRWLEKPYLRKYRRIHG